MDVFGLFAYFMKHPLAATGPAIALTMLTVWAWFLKRTDHSAPACFWWFAVSASMWWLYSAWEYSVFQWVQDQPPGPIIRADLVLLLPVLLFVPSLAAITLVVHLVSRFEVTTQPDNELRSWQDEDDPRA